MIKAKAFRTFIRIYSLHKSDRVSASIKVILYKALISVMTYACPVWELAADMYHIKLQHLENKVLCTTGNIPKCTLVHHLCTAFNLPCVYDYTTKLCRQQA
jgi:hypothetical protein